MTGQGWDPRAILYPPSLDFIKFEKFPASHPEEGLGLRFKAFEKEWELDLSLNTFLLSSKSKFDVRNEKGVFCYYCCYSWPIKWCSCLCEALIYGGFITHFNSLQFGYTQALFFLPPDFPFRGTAFISAAFALAMGKVVLQLLALAKVC